MPEKIVFDKRFVYGIALSRHVTGLNGFHLESRSSFTAGTGRRYGRRDKNNRHADNRDDDYLISVYHSLSFLFDFINLVACPLGWIVTTHWGGGGSFIHLMTGTMKFV